MTSQVPFVSILIPVNNGATYIKGVIQSVINQIDGDLEVVVGIDDSADGSESLIRDFDDSRMRVFKHDQRLGMTGNYRFLVSKARGEWLTILGQDDALVPFATSVLRRITRSYPRHELVTSRRSYLFWPDTQKPFGKYSFIYPVDTRKPRVISSHKFLKNAISGFREYSEGPQLYTGTFAKKSLVDQISLINQGDFYNYLIPDVCSAAHFLINTSEFIFSPLPLFIVGTSSDSTGIAIDKLISQAAELSQGNSIIDFFSSSPTSLGAPGYGIFTSCAWYMYEAYTEAMRFQNAEENETSQRHVSHLALAALNFESRKNNNLHPIQQRKIQQLSEQMGVGRIELVLRQFISLAMDLRRIFTKYATALVLLLSRRLILSKADNKQIFTLTRYVSMITSNKHLRDYLGDSN